MGLVTASRSNIRGIAGRFVRGRDAACNSPQFVECSLTFQRDLDTELVPYMQKAILSLEIIDMNPIRFVLGRPELSNFSQSS